MLQLGGQSEGKRKAPKRRQFLTAEDLSFLENKEKLQQVSDIGSEDSSGIDGTDEVSSNRTNNSGIPIKINTVIAADFSKLKKDAQIVSDETSETANAITPASDTVKVTEIKLEVASTTAAAKTTKSDTSWLIQKSDIIAIVSQDPALKTLISATTQKFRPTSSPKPSTARATNSTRAETGTSSGSTPIHSEVLLRTTPSPATTSTHKSTTNDTLSLFHPTSSNIPLMVGGGLALFIIMLLVAIVVLLVKLKNKKGDLSMRHDGSNRSNLSRETEMTDCKFGTASTSRRESKDSNVYSEIGSEYRDDVADLEDDYDDDDVIYYWGESEWDAESRHNSVLSISYTAKTDSARNSTVSGSRLSTLGAPKRGRRKSSLIAQCRQPGSNADLRKNRQSNAGTIFCIPENDDEPVDKGKKIEIKKDDMYKKVLKEKRSQSLF